MFSSASPAILTYHHIDTPAPNASVKASLFVSADLFDRQLQWLKDHSYTFLPLPELCMALQQGKALPDRAVVLTFDDGFTDNFDNALPILQKHGASATFFITTGQIGQDDSNGFAHMSDEQIQFLHRSGMSIGSHTVSHAWLGRLSVGQAREELARSKQMLEDITASPVNYLCYPSGSFSDAVVEEARNAGYRGACSVIRDNRVQRHQLYWLPRIMIMNDTRPERFSYLFSWLYHALHVRKNRKRWGNR